MDAFILTIMFRINFGDDDGGLLLSNANQNRAPLHRATDFGAMRAHPIKLSDNILLLFCLYTFLCFFPMHDFSVVIHIHFSVFTHFSFPLIFFSFHFLFHFLLRISCTHIIWTRDEQHAHFMIKMATNWNRMLHNSFGFVRICASAMKCSMFVHTLGNV